jgi:uncharacterized membrane protein
MQLSSWFFSIVLYFAFSTAYGLLQRHLSQKSKIPLGLLPALALTIVLYPVGVVIALLSGKLWIHVAPQLIPLLLAESILIGTFNVALFRLNKHIDATQFVIINQMYTIATVAIGVLALHEAFSGKQFLGMVLLIIGAVLVAVKGFRRSTFQFDKYSIELAIFSVLFGAGLAAEKATLSYMSIYMYFIIGWGMQFTVSMLTTWKEWKLIRTISKNEWSTIIQVGITRGGQALAYISSINLSRNIALITTITSFRIPLMFIASYFILREKDHLNRKLVGVLISTIGLFLLK